MNLIESPPSEAPTLMTCRAMDLEKDDLIVSGPRRGFIVAAIEAKHMGVLYVYSNSNNGKNRAFHVATTHTLHIVRDLS